MDGSRKVSDRKMRSEFVGGEAPPVIVLPKFRLELHSQRCSSVAAPHRGYLLDYTRLETHSRSERTDARTHGSSIMRFHRKGTLGVRCRLLTPSRTEYNQKHSLRSK